MRPFENKGYYGVDEYIKDPKYAEKSWEYIKAFELIQKDLINIFDFIEPSEENLTCYSFRIHELFLRSCVEIEANFKAILKANSYVKKKEEYWNMGDYEILANTHNLASYTVKVPYSHDVWATRKPFAEWPNEKLPWYGGYNAIKHSRVEHFTQSNLGNLLDAVCGLLVILSAQFYTNTARVHAGAIRFSSNDSIQNQLALGNYFLITFPSLDTWGRKKYTQNITDGFEFTNLVFDTKQS